MLQKLLKKNDPERKMWQDLSRSIGNNWDASRHENQFGEGMADVSFAARGVNGWIELKVVDHWPAKDETIVEMPKHFKKQKVWLYRRGSYGGHTWLLLKVQREWLLFDHKTILRVGTLPRHGLRSQAIVIFIDVPPAQDFLSWITGTVPNQT